MSKPFLADRVPSANMLNTTNTSREEFAPFTMLNTTFKKGNFETDIYNVYFLFGSCCMVGMILQLVSWLHTGCKLCFSLQLVEGQTETPSLHHPQLQHSCNLVSLCLSVLLSVSVFLGFTVDATFGGLGMTFTVNCLGWTAKDASNLVTLYVIFLAISGIISIFLAKCFQAKTLMIASSIICLGGNMLMALMINITQFSLWIGACLVGLGLGNVLPNALNAGKRLPGQISILSSVIVAGAYTARLVAPPVTGYLLDHEDPLWFVYICVVYSSVMLVLSLVFPVMLLCKRRYETVEQQECDVELQTVQTPDQ